MKRKIAIVAGGDSSEWVVSLRSAAGIFSFIDGDKYDKYIVTIVGQKWEVELADGTKLPIDKNDFSFTYESEKVKFDYAYITIHGTPGENGILQGYFNLIELPFSCCDVLAAALTFDKYACNHFLKSFGLPIAKSLVLRAGETITSSQVEQEIGFPCFIKPSVGGSSFGVTKVKCEEEVLPAIEKAFAEGKEVMVEAFLEGTEVTSGMLKTNENSYIFPLSEVVTDNEFFDYDAKYNGQVEEITPARISNEITKAIQETTARIYELINAHGIIRIDYIIASDGSFTVLEVNTTPGMTATSFIPQQVAAANLNITELMTEIIEDSF